MVIYLVESAIAHLNNQDQVVQKLDSAIDQINRYPEDKYYENQSLYPLDGNLSSG